MTNKNNLSIIAIILAVVGVIMSLSLNNKSQIKEDSLAKDILARGTVRIGYVVYPPSLIKDPNTGELSGISYDVVESTAKNLNLKTEWVEEVGWGSMIEGLRNGRYDMIGTLIWPNAARAREAVFSTPMMYSVVFPYVRANNSRFDAKLSLVNNSQYIIGTIDGEMTSVIASTDFPEAKTYALPQLSSISEVLVGLVDGKADLTFVEPAIAKDFSKEHPGVIKQISGSPVRTFENVLAFRQGENTLVSMWNVALKELIYSGEINRIVEKYKSTDSFFPVALPVGKTW